jgi:hypothetical protein
LGHVAVLRGAIYSALVLCVWQQAAPLSFILRISAGLKGSVVGSGLLDGKAVLLLEPTLMPAVDKARLGDQLTAAGVVPVLRLGVMPSGGSRFSIRGDVVTGRIEHIKPATHTAVMEQIGRYKPPRLMKSAASSPAPRLSFPSQAHGVCACVCLCSLVVREAFRYAMTKTMPKLVECSRCLR